MNTLPRIATLSFIPIIFVLTACNDNAPTQSSTSPQSKPAATQVDVKPTEQAELPQESTPQPLGDTSQNALDWNGTYQGIIPCASCEGIETRLSLSLDGSYALATTYLGKENQPAVTKGTFKWDDTGSKIQLDSGSQYQVGENQLFLLDIDGNRINGELAEHYRLQKATDSGSGTGSGK